MKAFLQPLGNTPFEISESEALHKMAHSRAAVSLQELIIKLNECDVMIDIFKDEMQDGTVTDETRALATEAIYERKDVMQSIDDLSLVMNMLISLEA